jgi:ADP-heptose:LPS heptosyltransferase
LLLVRLDAIGDFIVWLDTAKEYRRLYPGQRIVLCTSSAQAEIANKLPYWDEVWPVDMSLLGTSPIYRLKLFRKIRRSGFSTAIQPTFSRVFSLGDAVIRASGAIQRIGSVGNSTNLNPFAQRISDRWYTKLVAASQTPLAELERNAEFIRNLSGGNFPARTPVLPKFNPLPERLKIDGPYFVIFPGASWSGRQWPATHFVEVVTELHRQYGWRAVVCGGPSEKYLCQSIVNLSAVAIINLSGETSLPELVELLRGAEILISNETSAVHLAAAVSTPTVCILGGGHFGRFLPYPAYAPGSKPMVVNHEMSCYQCNWHCTQPHAPGSAVPCISGVTVASVLASARVQLQDKSRRTLSNELRSPETYV